MKVFYGIGSRAKRQARGAVVTVGVFDGVHRGHQKIVSHVVGDARHHHAASVVVTFSFHPSRFLSPRRRVAALTSLEHKLRLLRTLGVDVCYVLPFNRRLAEMSPRDFVVKVLIKNIGMASLCVGEDFVFGRKGLGHIALLKQLARQWDFRLHVFKHFKVHGRIVKSTLIRSLISQGDLKNAERLLGRRVSFLGEVVRGEGRGRTLGFPTANIRPHHEVLAPDGVYASVSSCDGSSYNGLTYIGFKPTFARKHPLRSVEVFLFGTKLRLYGRKMEVSLLTKLRGDKKFASADLLKRQMERDVKAAQKIFKRLR